ncbi:hypothetical protein BDQ17DRAFT_1363852 [Cyathus striatus]|nr:hypothetical protein BDQ17DRAFT_1363852 [Cyathus striatus]
MSSQSTLQLFPAPNRGLLKPAGPTPRIWAGVSPARLTYNHERWNIFFNHSGFHNHSAHIVLALWTLGAHESILEAAYKLSSSIQRPAFVSPSPIDDKNWKDHLGDEDYYNAYMNFFKSKLEEKGYIFSTNANVVADKSGKLPGMAVRFIEGLIHPFIHTGYGFEFGMPGMVVEGLAMAAVHEAKSFSKIMPASMSNRRLKDTPKNSVHALTILARVQADPRFAPNTGETADLHKSTLTRMKRTSWLDECFIYGIGCYQGTRPVKASFFHMHLVTSSIFLSSVVGPLSPSSQKIMLRTYLTTSLAWPTPSPNKAAFPDPTSPYATTPNPWLPIVQSTIVNPNDHIIKLQRALSHFASSMVGRGLERLDGTLFLRVAILSAGSLGWVREGQELGGFENDE